MTDDAKNDETPPTLEQKILEVLADHDYNGGAGMHWHPSKTPTDQAKTVAARITRMVSEHVDTAWEKPALDRLQELAEQRGYSRGFDIGWASRGDTDKKARPRGAQPGDAWVISFLDKDGERVVMDVDPVAAIDQLSLVATREDPALAAALDIESVKEMKHVILVIRDALRQRSLALGLDVPKSPEALTKALAGTIAGIS